MLPDRRPGDLHVHRGPLARPMAVDFAVVRAWPPPICLRLAGKDLLCSITLRRTKIIVRTRRPLVIRPVLIWHPWWLKPIETHSGAMSLALRSDVDFMARAHTTFDRNACHQLVALDIAQRISVSVIREWAWAVLKRFFGRIDCLHDLLCGQTWAVCPCLGLGSSLFPFACFLSPSVGYPLGPGSPRCRSAVGLLFWAWCLFFRWVASSLAVWDVGCWLP
eukprot:5458780-Amphidinium_carterae.3